MKKIIIFLLLLVLYVVRFSYLLAYALILLMLAPLNWILFKAAGVELMFLFRLNDFIIEFVNSKIEKLKQ